MKKKKKSTIHTESKHEVHKYDVNVDINFSEIAGVIKYRGYQFMSKVGHSLYFFFFHYIKMVNT